MAIFLDVEESYRLMQRELPEGAYADGAPSAFFTTASIYAKAKQVEQSYDNMERIYDNMFPQSADENILDWEQKVFGRLLDASLTLQQRRDLIIARMRVRPGINKQAISDIVTVVLGEDALFDIIEWNCSHDGDGGGWILDESQLDINTYLNSQPMSDVTPSLFPSANFCINDPQFGKTDQEWAEMQEQAYTYEVIIYGMTLTAQQRYELDRDLTAGEPARSQHVITDGADVNDMIGGEN